MNIDIDMLSFELTNYIQRHKMHHISCAYSVAEVSSYDLSEDVAIEEGAEH